MREIDMHPRHAVRIITDLRSGTPTDADLYLKARRVLDDLWNDRKIKHRDLMARRGESGRKTGKSDSETRFEPEEIDALFHLSSGENRPGIAELMGCDTDMVNSIIEGASARARSEIGKRRMNPLRFAISLCISQGEFSVPYPDIQLTPDDHKLLLPFSSGLGYNALAMALGVTDGTVSKRLGVIQKKWGASGRINLLGMAATYYHENPPQTS